MTRERTFYVEHYHTPFPDSGSYFHPYNVDPFASPAGRDSLSAGMVYVQTVRAPDALAAIARAKRLNHCKCEDAA